ncbi:MAG TPA: class I SAM-dependent methyltransferase [Mycobacteriales bacterium]|nr:class I SAM-dependent methyltransferase [Mycobacteriales bacterium]
MRRYAAGRARALGLATRGTTAPNRLRRVDRRLTAVHGDLLRRCDGPPLVVDLGFGSSPVTTVELHARLRAVRPDVQVVGLEIDPERVAAAQAAATDGLRFALGGFELAGLRPVLVRALNVLRQYDEPAVAPAWRTLLAGLAPGGLLVEGTCDELGRLAGWVELTGDGPRTLVLAASLATLERPAALAERLPKALIHRNVPGEPVHALLRALDDAWDRSGALEPYGPRQRWVAACAALDWPGADVRRARLGELSVPWDSVAPR